MILPLDSDLEPVIFGPHFDILAEDKGKQADELARCAEEPWYTIVNYCWTIRRDEDNVSHVERVPPKEYLRLMANDWYVHNKYMSSKSRQMMATWLFIILHLLECMFKEHQSHVCQTKKEDDADAEMIQRAYFVHQNMPLFMRKACPAKYSFCRLIFPVTHSKMRGIPAGGDQIRSRNPNRLLSDEFAFQQAAEESYTAALACCMGITLVSSANPSFMRDLVKDKIRPGL